MKKPLLLSKEERILLEEALKVMKKAHVLWGLAVGAAVLAEDGNVYEGCNVESWVSGIGTCAERNAIDHAVLHGNKKIMKIAIVMKAEKQKPPRPCGACLQYIHDFAFSPEIKVIMARAEGQRIVSDLVEIKTLAELLPFPYEK
jgi:cytidine deaminase